MSFRQTTVSGFPAIALRNEEIEVVAIPAIGMKLSNLRRLRGREWLWRSDQIPLALPRPGASYIETADSGGWDECFPTVGPSSLPVHATDFLARCAGRAGDGGVIVTRSNIPRI